jgi:hypothetical protein
MKWKANNSLKELDGRLQYRYGITFEQFLVMLIEQKGCCAICQQPFDGERPIVEHDHKTNFVRGLVHYKCNTLLVAIEDVKFVGNALRYLASARRRFREQERKIRSGESVRQNAGQAI